MHLLGAGAGMALLAGCSGSSDDRSDENGTESDDEDSGQNDPDDVSDAEIEGDLPSYASLLPENEDSEYFYGAIDLVTMDSLLNDQGAEEGNEPSDPLLGNPIVVALYCSFGISLLGRSASYEPYREHEESDDGNQTFVYVDGVYAFTGAYSFDGLTAALEDVGYDAETSADTYAVYTDPDSGEAVGVSEDVFAFSYPNDGSDFDPVAAVERTVATATGQRDPKHETDEKFEALLRSSEADGITLCLYTTDDELDSETLADGQSDDDAENLTFAFEDFTGAFGVHQRLSITEEDVAARATATISYSTEDRVDEARLESGLGTDADTVSVDRDGTTVTVAADYQDEVIEE